MRTGWFCFLFLIFLSGVSVPSKPKYHLSVVSVFQNEARFLKEWIEFHKVSGVEHFYLYNNLSNDHYSEVLKPYVEEGLVELIEWPYPSVKAEDWNDIQCKAFMDGISRTKKCSKWVAFIDTDEFLFATHKDSLRAFLKEYEEFAAVAVNWQCYGTSRIQKIEPHQWMIEQLVLKAPKNAPNNFHIKSIVQPKKVISCSNPHFFTYQPSYHAVSESKKIVEGPKSEMIEIEHIRINHYWSRDLDFLLNDKLQRQNKWVHKTASQVLETDASYNQEVDKAIYPILLKLKSKTL